MARFTQTRNEPFGSVVRGCIFSCSIALLCARAAGFELVEPEGGFAYQVPAGWVLVDNPLGRHSAMFRFKMAVDEKHGGRIAVTVWYDTATLHPIGYLQRTAIDAWLAGLPSAEEKMVKARTFETSPKQRAIELFVPRKTKAGSSFHEWVYLFARRDNVMVEVNCVGPGDGSLDRVIQSAMRTFRITR